MNFLPSNFAFFACQSKYLIANFTTKLVPFNLKHQTMKVTKAQINNFLEQKRIAVAGVSRNEKKFGNAIFKELKKNQYDVLPINPEAELIDGTKCYKTISELPSDIESLLIVTPKRQTDAILKQAFEKGIKNIWVQQHSETAETSKLAKESGKEIIFKKCIFMFANPTGPHKFHRSIVKIFGGLPK
jgi:predicted CoA-binding protein